jgi:hypothetical protein
MESKLGNNPSATPDPETNRSGNAPQLGDAEWLDIPRSWSVPNYPDETCPLLHQEMEPIERWLCENLYETPWHNVQAVRLDKSERPFLRRAKEATYGWARPTSVQVVVGLMKSPKRFFFFKKKKKKKKQKKKQKEGL